MNISLNLYVCCLLSNRIKRAKKYDAKFLVVRVNEFVRRCRNAVSDWETESRRAAAAPVTSEADGRILLLSHSTQHSASVVLQQVAYMPLPTGRRRKLLQIAAHHWRSGRDRDASEVQPRRLISILIS